MHAKTEALALEMPTATDESEITVALKELNAVELALVGGGTANVAFF